MSSKTHALMPVGEALPAPVEPAGYASADPLASPAAYRHAMELAATLAQSQLLPKNFQNKPADVFMAMLLARRMGEDVFTILQNVHFVGNKPGWSASFMIARANQSGIFSTPLTWETTGAGDDMAVTCSATLAKAGQVVSRTASMRMARAEGWTKNSKYHRDGLAEQMLAYRSSSLLLRLYAPQIMYGLHTEDEWQDVAAARGEPTEYIDPPSPPSPSPSRRPSRPTQPAPGGGGADGESGGLASTVAASSGEAEPVRSGEFEPHAPASALSPTPAADSDSLLGRQGQGDTSSPSSPSVLDGPQSSSGDSSASTGQDGLEGMRARLLRAIGPEGDLETVNAWRASLGKQPLEQLSPEHRESALQWFEAPNGTARYLSWVAAQQAERQQRREDAAVRATLLTQAREVLAELNDAVAGEVFERLGLATLDDATEAQLRAVVTLGRGAGGGA